MMKRTVVCLLLCFLLFFPPPGFTGHALQQMPVVVIEDVDLFCAALTDEAIPQYVAWCNEQAIQDPGFHFYDEDIPFADQYPFITHGNLWLMGTACQKLSAMGYIPFIKEAESISLNSLYLLIS